LRPSRGLVPPFLSALLLLGCGGRAAGNLSLATGSTAGSERQFDAEADRPETVPVRDGGTTEAFPLETRGDPRVNWCSSGGAPVVGSPVLDEQNRAYVATSDGYLHAFEEDGRYRWSYTVKGTPLGSVSLRPSDGVILMGTTGRYVYAINQAGTLHWAHRTVTPVWSGLFALNPSIVVFLGLDRRLYALTNTGSARYRVKAPGVPMGEPLVSANDVVWVPLADGVARFHAAYRLEKFELPSAVEQIVAIGEDAVVRAGGNAYRLRSGSEAVLLGPAVSLASNEEELLVVAPGGSVSILQGEGAPAELSVAKSEVGLSASPALSEHDVWLPQEDGSVLVHSRTRATSRRVSVGESPIASIVVAKDAKRALVTDVRGSFCSLTLPAYPSPE